MTAALKLRLKQQLCLLFGLKLWRNTLRSRPQHLKTLLLSPISYMCEAVFSAVAAIKTKHRNELDISNTLRVS